MCNMNFGKITQNCNMSVYSYDDRRVPIAESSQCEVRSYSKLKLINYIQNTFLMFAHQTVIEYAGIFH